MATFEDIKVALRRTVEKRGGALNPVSFQHGPPDERGWRIDNALLDEMAFEVEKLLDEARRDAFADGYNVGWNECHEGRP
jgi:hypothetical protein